MIYSYSKDLDSAKSLITAAARSLKKGRVLVLPTDTIYGLSCRADDKKAIKKIFLLKKRDHISALLVLVNSLAMLKKYVFVSSDQVKKIKDYWQNGERPTTVILRHRGLLPKELTGTSDGLALRLPKSKFLIKILGRVGVPLVSTSLNASGEKTITDLSNLLPQFPTAARDLDLVIDSGKSKRRQPSRLIDLRAGTRPIVLRK